MKNVIFYNEVVNFEQKPFLHGRNGLCSGLSSVRKGAGLGSKNLLETIFYHKGYFKSTEVSKLPLFRHIPDISANLHGRKHPEPSISSVNFAVLPFYVKCTTSFFSHEKV